MRITGRALVASVSMAISAGALSSVLAQSAAVNQSTEPVPVGRNVPAPTKVKHVLPIRPADAPKDDQKRVVVLQLTISALGRVEQVKVLRPTLPSLDRAAEVAVKQWEFSPVAVKGRAIAVTYNVRVDFPCAFEGCNETDKQLLRSSSRD